MTLNFSPYSSFNYKGKPNNQVWVVTSGGLGSAGPARSVFGGTKVTFNFNPPLTLSSASSQETSSYFFGMISPHIASQRGKWLGYFHWFGTIIVVAESSSD